MTTTTIASTGQTSFASGYTLGSDGDLTNTGVTIVNDGTVGASATQWGVQIYGSGNTVINYGIITPVGSGGPPSAGVAFATGNADVLINKPGATLASSDAGFYAGSNSSGRATNVTVVNGGVILGQPTSGPGELSSGYDAVVILDSGVVTNLSTGTIETNGISFYSGTADGATATSNVSVVNSGIILGGPQYGAIYMLNGGNVTNLAGTISGNHAGLYGIEIKNENGLNTPSTITNAGTIAGGVLDGSGSAIILSSVAGNRVIDRTGGVFIGTVNGGSNATMELASSGSAGTLTATSDQFTQFTSLYIDSNAAWTIKGDSTLATEFPKIGGFAVGDTISLSGLAQTPTTFSSSTAVNSGTTTTSVTIKANSTGLETLTLLGSISSGQFVFVPGATSDLTTTACFLTGTRIATEAGARQVEALRIGDLVLTLAGDARPIRWIGRRSVDPRGHPRPEQVRPLRIAADTFGPGRPVRPLFVSPDHGIYMPGVDGDAPILVPAGLLANGGAIAPVDLGPITYWHIELETHDIILAEGLPVESYLDAGSRDNFADHAAPVRLHANFSPASNAALWEVAGCLPLVLAGPRLDMARRQIGDAHPDPGSCRLSMRPRRELHRGRDSIHEIHH